MAAPNEGGPSDQPVTSTDRIKELNEIDADITRLLRCASGSIQILTGAGTTDSASDSSSSISARQASFTDSTKTYYSLLTSVNTRLRSQILALRGAGIIPAGTITKERGFVPGTQNVEKGEEVEPIVEKPPPEMGMGALDIGWLNSRNDSVGKEMEAELWAKAREFLEKLEDAKRHVGEGDTTSREEGNTADTSMQED
ncbi:MAG: hypothetical protein M4579_004217 [Chaenotheca gracillima]|nr:MAG: hypothetical protein M4579_004217 [Chaenotheca gracillima]